MSDMTAEMQRGDRQGEVLPQVRGVLVPKEEGIKLEDTSKAYLAKPYVNQAVLRVAEQIVADSDIDPNIRGVAYRAKQALEGNTIVSILEGKADWRDYLTNGEKQVLEERRKAGNYGVEGGLRVKAEKRQQAQKQALVDFLTATGGITLETSIPVPGIPDNQPVSGLPEIPPIASGEAAQVSNTNDGQDRPVRSTGRRAGILPAAIRVAAALSTLAGVSCSSPAPTGVGSEKITIAVTPEGELKVTKESVPTKVEEPPRVITVAPEKTVQPLKEPTIVAKSDGIGGAIGRESRLFMVKTDIQGWPDQAVKYDPLLQTASLGVILELPGYTANVLQGSEIVYYKSNDGDPGKDRVLLTTWPVTDGFLPNLYVDKEGVAEMLWVNAKKEVVTRTEALSPVPPQGQSLGFDTATSSYYLSSGVGSERKPFEIGLPRVGVISGEPVNIRKGPGTDFEATTMVYANASLWVRGQSQDEKGNVWYLTEWYDAEGGKYEGWISGNPTLVKATLTQDVEIVQVAAVPTKGPTVQPTARSVEVVPKTVPTGEVTPANESIFFKSAFSRTLEGTVNGKVKVEITIGLMKDVVERSLQPVKSFDVIRADAGDKYAELWLKMCYLNHQKNGGTAKTFEEYVDLVAKGEGKIRVPAVNEAVTQNPNQRSWEEFDPRSVILTFVDTKLPVRMTEKNSVYIGKNTGGTLVVVENALQAWMLGEQETFSADGSTVEKYKDMALSIRVFELLHYPGISPDMDQFLLRGFKDKIEWGMGKAVVGTQQPYVDMVAQQGPFLDMKQ